MRRLLLLAYSLSPAFAKISGLELLFGVGLVSLCGYFLMLRPDPYAEASSRASRAYRLALLAVAAYGVVMAAWLSALGMVHDRLLVVGIFTFLAPLTIVTTAGPQRAQQLLRDTPSIALVHAVLALLIYPPLRPAFGPIDSVGQILMEGTAAFRLSSVSGSLAMSGFMVVAFSLAIKAHTEARPNSRESRLNLMAAALFLLCGFMSLQRASWVALLLVGVVALIVLRKRRRRAVRRAIILAFAPLAIGLAVIDMPTEIVDLVIDRFGTITGGGDASAIAERSGQWANVLVNLLNAPLGYGAGQLGQAVRDTEPYYGGLPIYDGDYFRIISEYGFAGIMLNLVTAALALQALRVLVAARRRQTPAEQAFIAAPALGLMLQAIGTNVTELYFTNTLFWALLLQLAAWRPNIARPGPTRTCVPAGSRLTGVAH